MWHFYNTGTIKLWSPGPCTDLTPEALLVEQPPDELLAVGAEGGLAEEGGHIAEVNRQ